MGKNDITGAALISHPPTDEYREGWERIYGKCGICQNGNNHSNSQEPSDNIGQGGYYDHLNLNENSNHGS